VTSLIMSQMLFGSAAMKAEARSSEETVMNAHLSRDLLERSTILQACALDTRFLGQRIASLARADARLADAQVLERHTARAGCPSRNSCLNF
jgi:hypothetical protein